MKKTVFLSMMLTIALAMQAQKIVPQLQKGMEKVYVTTTTTKMAGQPEVTMTSETKYTVAEATADGYVVDMVLSAFTTSAAATDVAGQLISAAEELTKGVKVSLVTDKDGQVKGVKNYAEVKQQTESNCDKVIDKVCSLVPQLSQMMSKDFLRQQVMGSFTKDMLVKALRDHATVLMLNGKAPMTGAQEEYVDTKGIKMKRLYFVNGSNIVANATANMSKDELKAMIISEVEKNMPDQIAMMKQNLDQMIASGMLKIDVKEKATYDMQADGWVKSLKVESTLDSMGQSMVSKSETVMK
ncbi:MAG: hypothetical protein J6O54_05390 [Prevotella sp.]|nr:hypothetical protein [Prevotella sp.]